RSQLASNSLARASTAMPAGDHLRRHLLVSVPLECIHRAADIPELAREVHHLARHALLPDYPDGSRRAEGPPADGRHTHHGRALRRAVLFRPALLCARDRPVRTQRLSQTITALTRCPRAGPSCAAPKASIGSAGLAECSIAADRMPPRPGRPVRAMT